MTDKNHTTWFNTLAREIGVDLKHLPLLFNALRADIGRIRVGLFTI